MDKTAATTMCALALGDALGRQFGARVAAERVLPALCPLLVVPSLSAQQAATAMKVVRDMLARWVRGQELWGQEVFMAESFGS